MAKVRYWNAEEVAGIAEGLIKNYHPHLAGESIIYVFRDEHAEANGQIVFGSAKRVSGLNAYLANKETLDETEVAPEPLKLIEIAHDVWAQLTDKQRVALVDHELCHLGTDGMRAHDVEEFREVIDRHGLWRPSLEDFAAAISQQKLFPDQALIDAIRPKSGSVTISSGDTSVTLTA